jgi:hypothetical protein
VALQQPFLNEVNKIKHFPETYALCLAEADRRRGVATRFSNQVAQVSQFLAKEVRTLIWNPIVNIFLVSIAKLFMYVTSTQRLFRVLKYKVWTRIWNRSEITGD